MTLRIVDQSDVKLSLDELAEVVSIKAVRSPLSSRPACSHSFRYQYDDDGNTFCADCKAPVTGARALHGVSVQWQKHMHRIKELTDEAIERIRSTGADRCPFCGKFFKQVVLHGRYCERNPHNKSGTYFRVKTEPKP